MRDKAGPQDYQGKGDCPLANLEPIENLALSEKLTMSLNDSLAVNRISQ